MALRRNDSHRSVLDAKLVLRYLLKLQCLKKFGCDMWLY